MSYRSFEDLEVWQRACRQCTSIYEVFDGCKKYSLKDQIERASLSVPSNIAEGHERNTKADFQRFLTISLGSNAELFNPVKNAEIAYYMTNGGEDWSSWKGITPKTRMWMSKFPK